MRLNCLVKDTKLVQAIKDIMDIYSVELIDSTGKAPFKSIYNLLTEDGVEVDLESAAALYEAQFDLSQNYYTPLNELEDIAGKTFQKTLNAINNLEDKVIESQTGERSAARDAADKIARMFNNTLVQTHKFVSPMKIMQNALEKAVFSTIKKSKPKAAKKPLGELLGELLDETNLGIPNLKGNMNTMADVVTEWRAEMKEYRDGIKDKVTRDQWDKYVEDAVSSVYNVFLSKSQGRQIVDQSLFAKGFGKVLDNGTTVKDWKKMAGGIRSEEELVKNVEAALIDEVGEDNAKLISESLRQRYHELTVRQLDHNTRELTRRNKFKKHETQSELSRLLTLYNYGLFDPRFGNLYKRLLAKTVGAPVEDVAALGELQELLQDLNALVQSGESINVVEQVFNARIDQLLNKYRFDKSRLLRIMVGFDRSIVSSLKALLYTTTNLPQNLIGNKFALLSEAVGRKVTGEDVLNQKAIGRVAGAILRDVSKGGPNYGEVGNWFSSGNDWGSHLMSRDIVRRNEALQIGISIMIGNWALDGLDSATKYRGVQHRLIYNVRKIIVDNRRPANKTERKQFEKEANADISKVLYGESLEQATDKARQIVANSNGHLRNTEDFIARIADDIVKANIVNNGLLSAHQYSAAFEAAYFSAGEAIGHEVVPFHPLTPLSIIGQVSKGSRALFSSQYKAALGKGNYSWAAWWIFGDVLVNKIFFKFLGGASNWATIGIKSTGLGIATAFLTGKRVIDLSQVNEEDIKDELIARARFKHDMLLGVIGGAATAMTFLLLKMSGDDDDDDDFEAWLRKNKWAQKYAKAALPMLLTAYIYSNNDKLGQWFLQTAFLDDRYSPITKIKQAISGKGYMGRELSNAEREGLATQAAGQEFLQLPFGVWRIARDLKDVYKGAVLGQDKEWQDDPTSWQEGLLWGDALYNFGGVDYLKDIGIIPPKDISAVKGVGEKAEEALLAFPGFPEDKEKRLEFIREHLKNQLSMIYSDYEFQEKAAFRASKEFDIIYPEWANYSDADKHLALMSSKRRSKLKTKNADGDTVDIIGAKYVIPALVDISKE